MRSFLFYGLISGATAYFVISGKLTPDDVKRVLGLSLFGFFALGIRVLWYGSQAFSGTSVSYRSGSRVMRMSPAGASRLASLNWWLLKVLAAIVGTILALQHVGLIPEAEHTRVAVDSGGFGDHSRVR